MSSREHNSGVGGESGDLKCQDVCGGGIKGGGEVEVGVESKEESRRVGADGVNEVVGLVCVLY